MSMPRAVKHINEVRILDSLYRGGATTRADLARELGLMRSTVGNLIAGLIEQGLVRDGEPVDGAGNGRTGRPGQAVQLDAGHSAFIGADIGVGHLSVVVVDLEGRAVYSRTQAHEAPFGDVDETVAALAAMIRAAIRSVPAGQLVQGLCITVPGLVDHDGGVLRAPVLGWNKVPIRKLLRRRLKWRGTLTSENDANAFAAGELYGRSPGGSADALFVYLDAGVGGGMASHGQLLRGQHGHAGEIGHIHLGEHGFDAQSALQGSFESYVGRGAVLARHRHHGGAEGGIDEFIAAVQAEAPAALRTLSEWAGWLGRGLASLISVLDPGRIVLGGPVAALYRLAEAETLASVRRHLVPASILPAIEISPTGPDACAIGGAMMLHHALLSIDQRLVYGEGHEPG